jgi:nitronate monooxygenase
VSGSARGRSDASISTALTRDAGIELPLIGGAMYPCSNPELVAAVSASGGIGIVQPISLTYVWGQPFREGLRRIRETAGAPIGMNALIEASSRAYRKRMESWVDVALEEGVRFFVTSLGNPRWVVEQATRVGAVVYHDVTERRWALKALDAGVHGFIAVNRDAGGHAGSRSPGELLGELADLGLPVVCAGGVGAPRDFVRALDLGYAGVQIGTRLIATEECRASEAYKRAIVEAAAEDIVLSERITGVPLAVIDTPYVRRVGLRAGPFARWMLRGRRRKRWMRTFYALRSLRRLRRATLTAPRAGGVVGTADYWQAGRSVAGIEAVLPVREIVDAFRAAALEAFPRGIPAKRAPRPESPKP